MLISFFYMCGCSDKKNVDLQKIKLYLGMAKYEVKKEWLEKGLASTFADGNGGSVRIAWDSATQEELALVYEDFNGADNFIIKTNKTSEKTNSKKAKESDKDRDEGKE